jgi:hypothetical protein
LKKALFVTALLIAAACTPPPAPVPAPQPQPVVIKH